MSSGAEAWLDAHLSGVPEEFRPWLERTGRGAGGMEETDAPGTRPDLPEVAAELARRGLSALARAAARPGRERDSAFFLLAADAYFTWACEALLEEDDPVAGLESLIPTIASEGE